MNSRNLWGTSFTMAMVRNLRPVLLRPLQWVALSIGLCPQSLARHEALELGPEEAAPTLPAGGVKAPELFARTETAYELARRPGALMSCAIRGLPVGRGNILL
jgi:hypothetical protein